MINFKKLEEVAFALMPAHRGDMRSFHVAAIYRKSKLISIGYNKDITHPKIYKYRYHELARSHAELRTIIKGGREDYTGYSIAILRINRRDEIDYSCPCNGCFDMIRQLNFNRAYHTLKDGNWGELDIQNKKVEKNPQRFVCSAIRN